MNKELLEDALERIAKTLPRIEDCNLLLNLSKIMTRYNVQDSADLCSFLQKNEDES